MSRCNHPCIAPVLQTVTPIISLSIFGGTNYKKKITTLIIGPCPRIWLKIKVDLFCKYRFSQFQLNDTESFTRYMLQVNIKTLQLYNHVTVNADGFQFSAFQCYFTSEIPFSRQFHVSISAHKCFQQVGFVENVSLFQPEKLHELSWIKKS